jgi:hypothetical protein
MKWHPALIICVIVFSTVSGCFSHSHTHRLTGKIFHAVSVLEKGGPGRLYFGLYRDGTYQVCVSGRIAQDCYSGPFSYKNDTLTLRQLTSEVRVKYHRFLFSRYADKDSSYWMWKYGAEDSTWRNGRDTDIADALGDLWQIDGSNHILKDSSDYHFVVLIDSLSTQ